MKTRKTVAQRRNYLVVDVQEAKNIAHTWLENMALENVVSFGLPEVDDRYHVWRVPLIALNTDSGLGEVVICSAVEILDTVIREYHNCGGQKNGQETAPLQQFVKFVP